MARTLYEYFSYQGFSEIISKADAKKNICRFDLPAQNACFLRHDIDFSLIDAQEISKIESKQNIVSNFFIMVSSPIYNIYSQKSKMILKELISAGHLVGLHFDPSVYTSSELVKCAQLEIDILENVIENEIKAVSIHNPSVHGNFLEIPNYINVYSQQYFNQKNYLSDSAYDFKVDPLKFIEESNSDSIQILLHPLYYTSDNFIMLEFIDKLRKIYDDELDNVLKFHRKYPFRS